MGNRPDIQAHVPAKAGIARVVPTAPEPPGAIRATWLNADRAAVGDPNPNDEVMR